MFFVGFQGWVFSSLGKLAAETPETRSRFLSRFQTSCWTSGCRFEEWKDGERCAKKKGTGYEKLQKWETCQTCHGACHFHVLTLCHLMSWLAILKTTRTTTTTTTCSSDGSELLSIRDPNMGWQGDLHIDYRYHPNGYKFSGKKTLKHREKHNSFVLFSTKKRRSFGKWLPTYFAWENQWTWQTPRYIYIYIVYSSPFKRFLA